MQRAPGHKDCDSDAETVVCVISDDEGKPEKRKKCLSTKNRIQRSPTKLFVLHCAGDFPVVPKMQHVPGQKDYDSDADTVVCVISDDEGKPEKRNHFSGKNQIQRSPPKCVATHVAASGEQDPACSEVIYVRASDSESDSEDDCVIVESGSSCLPADFFERVTPPASPRKQRPALPRQPEQRNAPHTNVKVRDVQVKLRRIDEELLADIGVSSGDEHCVVEPVSCNGVSEAKQVSKVDQLDKHNFVPPMNMSKGTLSPWEKQKRNEAYGISSTSPDKSKNIRITLEIPYSKIFQFDEKKKSKLLAPSEHSHKTSKMKISKRNDKKDFKSQRSSKDVEGSTGLVPINSMKGGEKQPKAATSGFSESRNHAKKSKKHSHNEIRYRCEICWLRVPNVTDHIVKEHTHLFT